MTRRPAKIVAAVLLALLLGLLAGCGSEEEEEAAAVEGEPLELEGLIYNVQITRFLNPADAEDRNYLDGQEPAPKGQEYLAVFMRILNESEEAHSVPETMEIRTSRGQLYEPVPSESAFALELGAEVEPDGRIPEYNTPPASGPIKGSMVLFLVDDSATENRPLELEIPAGGETGHIELDL
jgi:hypothetical protein